MKQTIRIIGGVYRGKKLNFPDLVGLRPTPDRVRETLFNWLMGEIRDACCLDAFAGSGALGFEAFSRGASKVVFIEQAPIAYNNLKQIASSFSAPNLIVIKADANEYLLTSKEQFDIVFLDPPFLQDHLSQCMDTLAQTAVLAPHGLVYVESPDEIKIAPDVWEKIKLKRAGQVVYGLYKKCIPPTLESKD